MNKAIKLVMTGLLVSANMLAQETDNYPIKRVLILLTHYLVLFQDYMCYRMPAVPGQMVLLCMYVVWGLQTAKAR